MTLQTSLDNSWTSSEASLGKVSASCCVTGIGTSGEDKASSATASTLAGKLSPPKMKTKVDPYNQATNVQVQFKLTESIAAALSNS